jgi:hypothetical protein
MATLKQQALRKKSVESIAKSLKASIPKVEDLLSSPPKAYLAFAKEINIINRAVCSKDSEANPALFSLLANAANDIGSSMAALCKGAKAGDLNTLTQGDILAQSVEQFGHILNQIGESIKSECCFNNELATQINEFRMSLGDNVQGYYLVSENLSVALGGSALSISLSYPLLPPSGGCCGRSTRAPAIEFTPTGDSPDFLLFDEAALESQIEILGELLRQLLELLTLLAVIFAVMPAIFCSSECTPALTWMPSVVSTIPTNVNGGVQPSFTIQWDYCCQNTCFVWWTDEFIVTVATIKYDKGPIQLNNIVGRTRAVGLARRFGATFVNNVAAGTNPPLGGTVPAAAYPAVPTC